MHDMQSTPESDGIAFDALQAIESPCVLLHVGDERNEAVFANRAAWIDAEAKRGITLASLTQRLQIDETSRACMRTAARDGRAGNWAWRPTPELQREARLRLLPRKPGQPWLGVLTWDRGQRVGQASAELMNRFRAVFESALDPMLLADDAGCYVDANPAACTAFGYRPDEFRRLHVVDLLGGVPRERWLEAWTTFLARTRDEGRTRLRTRAGEERVFDYRAVANIQPGLHLSTLRDVTELARTTLSLIEREQQFRSLADHVPDPTFVLGLDGKEAGVVLYMNEAAEEAYGYRRDELLGRSVIDVLDSHDTAARSPERLDALRAGRAITFEGRHRRKDGSELAMEARARRITWEGRPAILSIVRDITAHHQAAAIAAAQAARAAERQHLLEWLVRTHITAATFTATVQALTERLATLFDCERVSLWLFEACGDLRCIDAHARTGNRHTSGTVMPASLHATEYEHLRRSRYIAADDPLHDPRTAGYADDYLRPNGITSMLDAAIFSGGSGHGTLCFEHVGKPHTWHPDEIEFACTIASQLALAVEFMAHADAEARAREREQFLTAILEGSPIGIQIFDPDGTPKRANAAQSRLLGASAQCNALTDPGARADGGADAFLRCKAGRPVMLERRGGGAIGGRDLDQMFFPVCDQTGAVTAIVQFTWDVGDRVATERTHKQLEAQLREAQKLEAVGLLAGGVAHDFNNILTAVLGFTGVLRDGLAAADPQRELTDQILKAAERGATLTRQLLAFSRKQVVHVDVLDPAALVREIEPMLRRLLEASVQLTVDAPAAGCIEADRGQFEQVLLNLVVNARDAMPNGGELQLAVARSQMADGRPAVAVRVRDTGVGMSDEVKAHAFEPFFTTKEKGKGTGLGLATVYGIVVRSGGTIHLDSRPGAGTTFELRWPLATRALPGAVAPIAQVPPTMRTARILLVEDDEPNRELATRILRRQGHTVTPAANGERALVAAAADRSIDLLVTDVVMPALGGRELAERLQRERPHLRVLFVSGYLADDALKLDLAQAGVALLQKPYSAEELTGAVDRLLQR